MLEVIPEKAGDREQLFARLSEIIDLPDDVLRRFERDRQRHRVFDSVPLKFNLSEEEVARFSVDRHAYEGVEIVPYLARPQVLLVGRFFLLRPQGREGYGIFGQDVA